MFLCRRRFYSDISCLKKIGGQWIFGGASDFSNLLAPWASGARSLMLRAAVAVAVVVVVIVVVAVVVYFQQQHTLL